MTTTQLSLCLILVSISTICAAAQTSSPVLDINGEEVRPGVSYNIVSAIYGAGGGGLTLGVTRTEEICPLGVVQEARDVRYGHPLTFHPADPKEGVIRLSTDINIKFDPFGSVEPCPQSLVWKLEHDEYIERPAVTTGGKLGNPGMHTIFNWFKIEQDSYGYKLTYCPSLAGAKVAVCRDLAIYWGDMKRRLVLAREGESPFRFVIQKAAASTSA